MAAGPVQIVEHRQQLRDHRGFGPVGHHLLITQSPLPVVGEVGLNPLQVTEQLGGLARFLGRLPGELLRCRPAGGRPGGRGLAHMSGLWINAPLVGDGDRLLYSIGVAHLRSPPFGLSSSTTSASTTSSFEAELPVGSPPAGPPAACSAWVAS